MIRNLIWLIFIVVLVGACAPKTLYTWDAYDHSTYSYVKNTDEKSLDTMMKVYEMIIKNPRGTRLVPPPGVCADYGYLLLKMSKNIEGKAMLEKEIKLYPESKVFVDKILKMIEK